MTKDGLDVVGLTDAAVEAAYRWHELAMARDLIAQADAVVHLRDAMSDLVSWLPGYDPDSGTMPWEREDT